MSRTLTEQRYKTFIIVISILVPLLVAVLIFAPGKNASGAGWTRILPHLNGAINSVTAVLLIAAFFYIKQGKIAMHKTLMLTSFALGCLFLISYIIYHASEPSAIFGDANRDGALDEAEKMALGYNRMAYLALLLTHIALAIVVAPLVLFALYHALGGRFDRHRKIVKFAYPVWLYVSVSGVIVYLMIRPFY